VQIIEANLEFRNRLAKRSRTDYIVLHHADWSECSVYDIHRSHLAKGWAGIGYAYFVSKDGEVYQGRPPDAIGAHCKNYNARSVGICAEGDYETEQMPGYQKNAIVSLLVWLKKQYPNAKIVGHRDLFPTACPGRNYPFLEILEAVKVKVLFKEVAGLFKDVPDNHWAKGSIERLAKLGLLKGDPKGNFQPDKPLTRAQLAAVLDRLLTYLGVEQ
jgi:N-acetyl-anhydromuramyl-L-alanine amidase AmpD